MLKFDRIEILGYESSLLLPEFLYKKLGFGYQR